MASDDIAELANALSKTHVGDGELSYKGLGLKLDNAESGQKLSCRHGIMLARGVFTPEVLMSLLCAYSGGAGP